MKNFIRKLKLSWYGAKLILIEGRLLSLEDTKKDLKKRKYNCQAALRKLGLYDEPSKLHDSNGRDWGGDY